MANGTDAHQTRNHWTVERWLAVLTFIFTALAITFGIGVNWARITDQDARQRAFEVTYLRRDVYESDQRRLSESIERLSEELKMWRQEQQPREPATQRQTTRRMFDR